MGKAHSNAYRQVPFFFPDVPCKPVMRAIVGRTESAVKEAMELYGWESYETSWQKLLERDDIDLVDISTPGDTHAEIAIAAAKAKKHIFCEKPLANTIEDARAMLKAVEEAGVIHMVNFNYRKCPAVALAKQLIEEGRIGQIYHFRGQYLQDWIVDPSFPLVWRLDKKVAGSGALGDLGAHLIDLARYLVGEITEVVGMWETFVKQRPIPKETGALAAVAGEEMGEVTVDDATLFLARFENGALGSFEATRFAPGHKNYNFFEINGSKGSIRWCFENMNELEFFSREDPQHIQGFRRILVTDSIHPYMKAWWPAGHIIGYEHTFVHQVYDLMVAIDKGELPTPNFYDGVKCQEVLAAVEKSIQEKRWVKIEEV
jgi:predicted dehydrogenase